MFMLIICLFVRTIQLCISSTFFHSFMCTSIYTYQALSSLLGIQLQKEKKKKKDKIRNVPSIESS